MKQALRDSYLSILTFIAVGFAVALGWSFAFSRFVPAITYGETNTITPAAATPGQGVMLCRDMSVNRRVVLRISRALTRDMGDGRMLRVDFGDVAVARGRTGAAVPAHHLARGCAAWSVHDGDDC